MGADPPSVANVDDDGQFEDVSARPPLAPDQDAAHLEYTQLKERVAELEEQVRFGEAHYKSAMLTNEQWRAENEHLRRLLVAVLPPDALYKEARELTRRLRAQQAR